MPACPSPLIGAHVPVAKGLARGAFPYARDIGAQALQVFTGNPRGWATPAGDPREDAAFRDLCERHAIPAYVHAPYLINLGSPDPTILERSVTSLAHALRRGAEVGARGVVVHTGSHVTGESEAAAMAQVREALLPLLDGLAPDGPRLLLEPTAGQGRSLCSALEDLPGYLAAVDNHPRAGLCLDTCHLFAAGAPLDVRGGMTRTLTKLVRLTGSGRLDLVHANDSKDQRGSRRDRHERVGRGQIGTAAFAALLRHPAVRRVPVILETPGGRAAWTEDIAALNALRR